jgi:hypothetical protein
MSEFEISIPIEGSQYNERIIVNKYGDQYSLVLGREGQGNGTVYMQWCHPSDKDKKPRPKAVPWKIPLGNYVQATTMLQALLAVFVKPMNAKNELASLTAQAKPEQDEDIPF